VPQNSQEEKSVTALHTQKVMQDKHKIEKRMKREKEAEKREKISQREDRERGEDDKTMSIILHIKSSQYNIKIGLNKLGGKP
jgi:hypothetical protein